MERLACLFYLLVADNLHICFPTQSEPLSLTFMAQRLLAWPKQATSEARNFVLGVLKSNNEPLSTREIFEKAIKASNFAATT